MRIRAALLLLAVLLPLPAAAEPSCHRQSHEGRGYVICSADPASDELRLFLRTGQGGIYGSFGRVNQALAAGGETLAFAMNAGMYHADRRPVGLYVEDGRQEMRAVAPAGPGNFGMLPNGVLCLEDGRAEVIETRAYLADPPDCRYATQSGPMLVIDGALHPRFLPDSSSRHIRNGVGVDAGGRLHFAISDAPVTFHEFARLFRDVLKTPNALYFDGKVSKLYAPDLGRNDAGLPMGPIVGAVVPAPD
ncbi:phosphodiester glycosidase family protein [Rhodovulum sp. YEN HP10]|uniref:phosphodiester glycosidase family protein n=1 Tax=Rhodovulum sp. HP10 TaxID=3387397 RepID=UPI0039E16781